MKNFLAEIFKNFGIEFYGFCDFYLLQNDLLECAAKKRLPINSSTVITCIFPYKVSDLPPKNISRYATVKDYHLVCGEILNSVKDNLKYKFSKYDFEAFIDNSPINEVKAAVLSGLGVKGKNGLLINERYGSFCFIGEIVTDYKIQTVNINNTNCINCGKCAVYCPSGFLKDKNNKCLSDITQQKKPLTENEEKLIKQTGCVWGCDICQECCPMNIKAEKTKIKEFLDTYRNEYIKGENIEGRAYAWRGEKVILRNTDLIK